MKICVDAMEQMQLVQEAFGRAALRGHAVRRVIRSEEGKAAAARPDCGARPLHRLE